MEASSTETKANNVFVAPVSENDEERLLKIAIIYGANASGKTNIIRMLYALRSMISNMTEKGKIKAVAAKDNITSIKIKSGRMLLATGFLRKVFEIFENYQTPIDMVTTSEVGVSVTIDNRKHLEEIVDDLKKYGTVTVDEDMVIVCVVGDLEWDNVGFEARIVQAMKDVPVRMISYGGSNYNVSLLVKASDKTRALQALSDHLFNN